MENNSGINICVTGLQKWRVPKITAYGTRPCSGGRSNKCVTWKVNFIAVHYFGKSIVQNYVQVLLPYYKDINYVYVNNAQL